MAQTVREVMTSDPIVLSASTTLNQAAQQMKQHHIGDVLVLDANDKLCGIITDRDLVLRGMAEGRDLENTALDDICTHQLVTVSPDASVSEAVSMMREKAVRRLPVVDDGRPVGIVSIGDLAINQDPDSALGEISKAPPKE